MKAIQNIPLDQIDRSDETFSVNFLPDLLRLRSSIEAMGLIQPVLLRKRKNGYQIVCGFRRVSVYCELRSGAIESRVLEEEEMDDLRFFSLSLQENLTTRGFNTVEAAIALDKLVHRFGVDRACVIGDYLPLFSLEPHGKILDTYLSLARLEDEVKRYVLQEEVSRSNIRKLSTLAPDDRMILLSLLSSLRLGENRLREILSLLDEISRREGVAVKQIVERKPFQELLSQENLTPSQRAERVKKVLMDFRYPRISRREEEFEAKKRELALPPSISLFHLPFFEGKGLRVQFQFETIEQYRMVLSTLSQLADKKEFEEMLEKDRDVKFQNPNVK